MMRIYFDNAATTPMHPEVIDTMTQLMKDVHGNPSSIHQAGRKARTIIEDARKTVANTLNSSIGEIFFTGSATEANNMLLRKAVTDLGVRRIIASKIEHPCVLNTSKELALTETIEVVELEVDSSGSISLAELERLLEESSKKTLVSIMHVNNELGVIQDIKNISQLCTNYEALFHCDAVQSVAKMHLDLQEIKMDFLSATAHKFHGPKGTGFMYINADHKINPFITGGGQERNMRSGTENVHGIAGLAQALKIYRDQGEKKLKQIQEVKSYFKNKIVEHFPDVKFIEDKDPGKFIPTILSVSFPSNPKTELMTFNLDIAGISASAGSACASGVEQSSPRFGGHTFSRRSQGGKVFFFVL